MASSTSRVPFRRGGAEPEAERALAAAYRCILSWPRTADAASPTTGAGEQVSANLQPVKQEASSHGQAH